MPFQLSPGVNVTEIDLTTVIPAVATTDAAIAGRFRWGPVDKPTLVVSEEELATVYGRPETDNSETFFTAASFLAYSNRLFVSRAHQSTGDDVRVNGFAINGANTILVEGSTSTGVSVGDILATTISGVADGTSVTAVETGDVTDDVTDLATDLDTGTNLLTVSNPFPFVAGESVRVATSNTFPTGLDGSTDFYISSITVGSTETTFGLATSQGNAGSGTIISFSDTGDGTLTLTRNGDTRISIDKALTVTTGAADFEFFDFKYSFNAIGNTGALDSDALLNQHIVKNEEDYTDAKVAAFDGSVRWVAKYPGDLGNSLKVSVCDSADAYTSNVTLTNVTLDVTVGANTGSLAGTTNTDISTFTGKLTVGDLLKVGNSSVGIQYLEVSAIPTISTSNTGYTVNFRQNLTITENLSLNGDEIERFWQYNGIVDKKPGQSNYVKAQGNTSANDEIHVVVVDEDGDISGIPNTILEVWQGLSRATDAKADDGGALYYKEVINQSSQWIWWANDDANGVSNTALTVATSSNVKPLNNSFTQGRNIQAEGSSNILGSMFRAYDKFKSAEDYDISLVLTGKSYGGSNTGPGGRVVTGHQLANYIIDNICERRKDCVAFVSPEKADVVANATDITEDVTDFRSQVRGSSYAVMDSGYKYMYDKYNDVYRWVPLNGDIAGLCANTDNVRDPWYSPAGFNRGNIKNVVKLAWNPKKGERDLLYKDGVNPIVNFPGQGIVMFGDKTCLDKPSAFDRINVRRLFIVLEKAIATAAQFTLFEFNDEFTRASFVNLVTPFLRDVQGRRGITDFTVVCDETNNTGEIIDRNEFVGDIYIKPARSINFIQLNFVAVRTGVEFSEVIGNFG